METDVSKLALQAESWCFSQYQLLVLPHPGRLQPAPLRPPGHPAECINVFAFYRYNNPAQEQKQEAPKTQAALGVSLKQITAAVQMPVVCLLQQKTSCLPQRQTASLHLPSLLPQVTIKMLWLSRTPVTVPGHTEKSVQELQQQFGANGKEQTFFQFPFILLFQNTEQYF